MFYNFKLLMSIYILNILLSTSAGEICLYLLEISV